MPSSYSPNLRLELIASGEQANTWGNTTNTNLGTLLENAITGYVSLVAMTDANYTLIALNGANDQARQMFLDVPISAGLTASRNIIAPSVPKVYVIRNNGGNSVVIKTASGTGVTIPTGVIKTVSCDGTNFSEVITGLEKLYLGTAVTDASASNQAVTKAFVDGKFVTIGTTQSITGAKTFTTAVTLPTATPTGYQATSQQYVNDNYIYKAAGGPAQVVETYLRLQYNPSDPKDATPKAYVDNEITDAIDAYDANVVATYVPKTLTINTGTGLSGGGNLSNNRTLTLNAATTSTLGGVKQGSGCTITGDGTLNIDAVATGITSVSVATSNGFAGSSSGGSTPQLTLSTTVNGILKGSGSVGSPSSVAAATAADIVGAIGSTSVQNATNATSVPWSGVTSIPVNYPGGCTGAAASAGSASSVPWSGVSGKPTTVSGYGITDAVSFTGSNQIVDNVLSISRTTATAYAARIGVFYDGANYYPGISSYSSTGAYREVVIVQQNNSGGVQLPLIFGPSQIGVFSVAPSIFAYNGGSTTGASIDNTGTIIRTPSDASLKENVEELTGGLNQILALNPVYYDWKNKEQYGAQRQIGFLAQEVEVIVPEVVSSGNDGLRSLDYAHLVATLTSAIQELNAKVETLTAEVNTLKGA